MVGNIKFNQELFEFANKIEKEILDEEHIEAEFKEGRCFDSYGGSGEVWEWIQFKIKNGATKMTVKDYNEAIINYFIEEPFWKNRSREDAEKLAKDWLLDG